jgi:hypothetical protein
MRKQARGRVGGIPGRTIVDHPGAFLWKDLITTDKGLLTDLLLTFQHLQLYNYSHGGPIYHPECDLCVMAPDGQFVAGSVKNCRVQSSGLASKLSQAVPVSAFRP